MAPKRQKALAPSTPESFRSGTGSIPPIRGGGGSGGGGGGGGPPPEAKHTPREAKPKKDADVAELLPEKYPSFYTKRSK